MRFAAILLLFLPYCLLGQDVRFSQFQLSTPLLNPATAGAVDGQKRIFTSYRKENSKILRGDGLRMYAVSFDAKKDLSKDYFLGYGLSGSRDRAGELRIGQNQGKLSLALGKQFRKDSVIAHELTVGGQVGIVKRMVDPTNARWHENMSTFHELFIPSFLYLDFSTGIFWSSTFKSSRRFFMGAAYHHINEPNISFIPTTNEEILASRLAIHGGGELLVSHGVSVSPTFLYQHQGPHQEVVLGSNLSYTQSSIFSLSGGFFGRFGKTKQGDWQSTALIAMGSIKINGQYLIAAAFDFSPARLRELGLNYAFELTVGYLINQRAERVSAMDSK